MKQHTCELGCIMQIQGIFTAVVLKCKDSSSFDAFHSPIAHYSQSRKERDISFEQC